MIFWEKNNISTSSRGKPLLLSGWGFIVVLVALTGAAVTILLAGYFVALKFGIVGALSVFWAAVAPLLYIMRREFKLGQVRAKIGDVL